MVQMLNKQGGKIIVITSGTSVGQDQSKDLDYFKCNDSRFQKIMRYVHRGLLGVDLFVFGGGRCRNLISLGEMIRLSGGDIFYYEQLNQKAF